MDNSKIDVLSGIPLFHIKDKKEICYIGRDKILNFDKIIRFIKAHSDPPEKLQAFLIVLRNEV